MSQKNDKEEELPKKGSWIVCRFKGGGACQEEGACFFEGGYTPIHTMLLDQTKGETKSFLGGSKKGSHIVRLLSKSTWLS